MSKETTNNLNEGVIIAGFGGQGIVLAGKLLAQTAMNSGREVTFIPAYGAEVRGGTSNCAVVIADEPIACPLINNPDSLIVMNKASLDKFAPQLRENGLLIYNSSLIEAAGVQGSGEVLAVPADEIAIGLGNVKCANMVILGAYIEKKGFLSIEEAVGSLAEVLPERLHKTIPINTQALKRGAEFVKGR